MGSIGLGTVTFRDAMSGGMAIVAVVIRRGCRSALSRSTFAADKGVSYSAGCTPPA
jgi:hypothetical protein